MAIFQDPERDQHLDWLMLRNSPVALYHATSVLDGDIEWLRRHGYVIYALDCQKWTTERAFHTSVSRALGFPSHYGRNLNAFKDCLSDLDVPAAGGMALVFWGFDRFAAYRRKTAQTVLDMIACESRVFSLLGRRLIALIQSDTPDIEFEDVGACPVSWNGAEWPNSRRGL